MIEVDFYRQVKNGLIRLRTMNHPCRDLGFQCATAFSMFDKPSNWRYQDAGVELSHGREVLRITIQDVLLDGEDELTVNDFDEYVWYRLLDWLLQLHQEQIRYEYRMPLGLKLSAQNLRQEIEEKRARQQAAQINRRQRWQMEKLERAAREKEDAETQDAQNVNVFKTTYTANRDINIKAWEVRLVQDNGTLKSFETVLRREPANIFMLAGDACTFYYMDDGRALDMQALRAGRERLYFAFNGSAGTIPSSFSREVTQYISVNQGISMDIVYTLPTTAWKDIDETEQVTLTEFPEESEKEMRRRQDQQGGMPPAGSMWRLTREQYLQGGGMSPEVYEQLPVMQKDLFGDIKKDEERKVPSIKREMRGGMLSVPVSKESLDKLVRDPSA
jgi:hypothetical protein